MARCKECNGDGSVNCPKCKGKGRYKPVIGDYKECEHCEGSGKKKCGVCKGKGTI